MEYVDIVFEETGDNKPPAFVEVENDRGASIRFGEWVDRSDGYLVLRIPVAADPLIARYRQAHREREAAYSDRQTIPVPLGELRQLAEALGGE